MNEIREPKAPTIADEWGRIIRRQRHPDRSKPPVLTQQQLGDRLDPPVHQSAVSQWESGVSTPKPEYQRQLIRVLGIPPDDVLRLARGAA